MQVSDYAAPGWVAREGVGVRKMIRNLSGKLQFGKEVAAYGVLRKTVSRCAHSGLGAG